MQLKQKFLTKDQVDVFKEQLAELLLEAKELLSAGITMGTQVNIDATFDNLGSSGNTDTINLLPDKASKPVEKKTEPILEKAIQMLQASKVVEFGISRKQEIAGGSPNVSSGSLAKEPSSDAEYYTPLASPDESRRSSVATASTIVSLG